MKKFRIFLSALLMAACMVSAKAEGEALKVYYTFPGSRYSADCGYPFEGETSAVITAWKQERVFLKIALEAAADGMAEITAGPLRQDGTETEIPVSAGTLESLSASLGLGENPSVPHETVFDRILQGNSACELSAGETSYFWITADVGNALAGNYEGTIVVHADQDYALSLTVIVAPYSLAEESMSLDLWQYPYSSYFRYEALSESEPFSDAHLDSLRQEADLYAKAGGTAVTVTITDEPWAHQTNYDTPSLVKWSRDGSGNLWFDYTAFDAWVSLMEQQGVDGMIECFSILPYGNALTIYDDMDNPGRYVYEPGTYEWKLAWQSFLYSFVSHLQEKGWLERTCLFADERGIEKISFVKEIMAEVPGAEMLKLGAAVNAIDASPEYYDVFDTVSLSVGALPEDEAILKEFLDHRKAMGLETTLYNCSTTFPSAFALSDPYESVWTMLYAASRGFDGFLRWAYNAWPDGVSASADNPNFESGDTFLIYPDERNSDQMTPAMSVRLCMMEQGRNDFLKYRILKNRLSAETRTLIEEGFARLPRYYGRDNGYGMLTHASEEERISMMKEVIRLEALIEKAAIEAAAEETGISYFEVKEEMQALS